MRVDWIRSDSQRRCSIGVSQSRLLTLFLVPQFLPSVSGAGHPAVQPHASTGPAAPLSTRRSDDAPTIPCAECAIGRRGSLRSIDSECSHSLCLCPVLHSTPSAPFTVAAAAALWLLLLAGCCAPLRRRCACAPARLRCVH